MEELDMNGERKIKMVNSFENRRQERITFNSLLSIALMSS